MTTQHPKQNFGIDDPKFKWGLILGIPCIPLVLGFLIGTFMSCYFFDCNTVIGKQFSEYSFWGMYGIGVFGFLMTQRITKHMYKRGELIWSALDRHNDSCFVCGVSLPETSEFYFKDDKVYCTRHDPYQTTKSESGQS